MRFMRLLCPFPAIMLCYTHILFIRGRMGSREELLMWIAYGSLGFAIKRLHDEREGGRGKRAFSVNRAEK